MMECSLVENKLVANMKECSLAHKLGANNKPGANKLVVSKPVGCSLAHKLVVSSKPVANKLEGCRPVGCNWAHKLVVNSKPGANKLVESSLECSLVHRPEENNTPVENS